MAAEREKAALDACNRENIAERLHLRNCKSLTAPGRSNNSRKAAQKNTSPFVPLVPLYGFKTEPISCQLNTRNTRKMGFISVYFVPPTLSIVLFAYDSPMTRACLEWPQRGAKKRNDMMIILLLFCVSCAFLWPSITLVAASPHRDRRGAGAARRKNGLVRWRRSYARFSIGT
jgi:hypothetical protein